MSISPHAITPRYDPDNNILCKEACDGLDMEKYQVTQDIDLAGMVSEEREVCYICAQGKLHMRAGQTTYARRGNYIRAQGELDTRAGETTYARRGNYMLFMYCFFTEH